MPNFSLFSYETRIRIEGGVQESKNSKGDLNFDGQRGKLIKHPNSPRKGVRYCQLTKGHLIQASVFRRGASVYIAWPEMM